MVWAKCLCVAAQPIQAFTSFVVARIVATPTVFFVRHWVHTLPLAANLRVLALLTTLSAILPVCVEIHTFFLAAIRARTARNTTYARIFVTCHQVSRFLCKKAAVKSSERSWFLAMIMIINVLIMITIVKIKRLIFFGWCCGESDGQGHEQGKN